MSNYSDSSYDKNNPNTSWYKVLHLIPKHAVVLDIGCSSGHFGAVLIKERQCEVDGIELDEHDAAEAKKYLQNVHILNVETDDLSNIKRQYNVVYFGDVIEHLINPVNTLKKIKPLLKPEGRVVFSIPNMANVAVRFQLLKGAFDYTETGLLDKTHLHFYTLDEVKRVLAEAGYILEKMEFTAKDYPNELMQDYLQELGLKATDKFYQLMHEPAAAAFQFVGCAKPTNQKVKVVRDTFGPIDLFEGYHINTVTPLKNRIEHLEGVIADLKTKNTELETRFKNLAERPIKTIASSLHRKFQRRHNTHP